MKLLIEDTEHDLFQAMQDVTLGTLDDLQIATLDLVQDGITLDYVHKGFHELADALTSGTTSTQLLGLPRWRTNLRALIFLALRNAGQAISWDDTRDYQPRNIKLILDEAPSTEARPKDAAADENPRRATTKTTPASQTSATRSPRT